MDGRRRRIRIHGIGEICVLQTCKVNSYLWGAKSSSRFTGRNNKGGKELTTPLSWSEHGPEDPDRGAGMDCNGRVSMRRSRHILWTRYQHFSLFHAPTAAGNV